jgi:D-fructose 1,6-bisphosphatase (EC 3.1.3.11)
VGGLLSSQSEKKTTVSVIKADIGSLAGHHKAHPDTLLAASRVLAEGKKQGIIVDYYVTAVVTTSS